MDRSWILWMFEPMNAIEELSTLNRLRSVQSLCSESDTRLPKAIVCIPGIDGRNNSGSVNLLKYLFRNSYAKELFDGVFDESSSVLEECVLLIRRDSVSILYNSAMKQAIGKIASRIPNLIEYCYSSDEVEDVDKFQFRKVTSFKKMILEALVPGDSVGITVPSGYDDVMEVETWPLLQSFALDNIVCSTGFFTALFQVIDITLNIETLFRAVDSIYVDQALRVGCGAMRSHLEQVLQLVNTPTVNERQHLTAEDLLMPLLVFYEFSEMSAMNPLETYRQPVLLVGAYSNDISNSLKLNSAEFWKNTKINTTTSDHAHLHFIVEASEATTGIRFCRTFFLRTGNDKELFKEIQELDDILQQTGGTEDHKDSSESKVNNDSEDEEFDYFYNKISKKKTESKESESKENGTPTLSQILLTNYELQLQRIVRRMQRLYLTLQCNLQRVVRANFLDSLDVLEAGTKIQEELIAVMTPYINVGQSNIPMSGKEFLQVHIDCMNSVGEIITIDDVDDLGGSCWVYIRVSVHNILLSASDIQSEDFLGAIAIGDTFLFSRTNRQQLNGLTRAVQSAMIIAREDERVVDEQHSSDAERVLDVLNATQCIPSYQAFIGSVIEEKYCYYLNRCIAANHIRNEWKLGKNLEFFGINAVSTHLLLTRTSSSIDREFSDQLLLLTSEVKAFSHGFLISRTGTANVNSIPVVVNFSAGDITSVSIVDLFDYIYANYNALEQLSVGSKVSGAMSKEQMTNLLQDKLSSGYLLIFNMRDAKKAEAFNRLFPVYQTSNKAHQEKNAYSFALFIEYDNRNINTFASILEQWKISFRVNDIVESRGASSTAHSAPALALLPAVRMLINEMLTQSYTSANSNVSLAKQSTATGNEEIFSVYQLCCIANNAVIHASMPSSQMICSSLFAMKAHHVLAESVRILFNNDDAALSAFIHAQRTAARKSKVLLVYGYAGHGIEVVSGQLLAQLRQAVKMSAVYSEVRCVSFDPVLELFQRNPSVANVREMLDGVHLESLLAEKLRAATQSANEVAQMTAEPLVLLSIAWNPLFETSVSELLTHLLFGSMYEEVEVVHVCSVSNAQILSLRKSSSEENNALLGAEFMSSQHFQMIHSNHLDSAITFDIPATNTSKTSATSPAHSEVSNYQLFKARLEVTSNDSDLLASGIDEPDFASRHQILRMTSHLAVFSEDELNFILRRENFNCHSNAERVARLFFTGNLRGGTESAGDGRSQSLFSRVYPVPKLLSGSARGGVIQSLVFTPQQLGFAHWHLVSVLRVFQMLFPAARSSAFTVKTLWQDYCQTNKPDRSKTFSRLVELATSKLLSEKHDKEIAAKFAEEIAGLDAESKTLLEQIAADNLVCSVYGSLQLRNQRVLAGNSTNNSEFVYVAANQSMINVHFNNVATTALKASHLIISGTFSVEMVKVLEKIFYCCQRFPMSLRKPLSIENFRGDDQRLKRLQQLRRFRLRALPDNCWFDGSFFVDYQGHRSELRPDIQTILEDYIFEENNKIDQYNQRIIERQLNR